MGEMLFFLYKIPTFSCRDFTYKNLLSRELSAGIGENKGNLK